MYFSQELWSYNYFKRVKNCSRNSTNVSLANLEIGERPVQQFNIDESPVSPGRQLLGSDGPQLLVLPEQLAQLLTPFAMMGEVAAVG